VTTADTAIPTARHQAEPTSTTGPLTRINIRKPQIPYHRGISLPARTLEALRTLARRTA
jgi:hypothetical protein